METDKTGGPAFPQRGDATMERDNGVVTTMTTHDVPGMTLLDAAALAILGNVAASPKLMETFDAISTDHRTSIAIEAARYSFYMAKAWIAERAKRMEAKP